MKDIEIAQKCTMEPIGEVAKRAGLTEDEIDQYGKYKAKISLPLKDHEPTKRKLVLVTAINPTPAGEGKSTVTVGLADAIVDLTETGTTLKENNLEIYAELGTISTRLVANPISLKQKKHEIFELVDALENVCGGI